MKPRTPLHTAAACGDVDLVERLIVAGADVNAQDEYGWTPLLEAAANGKREDVVRRLIAYGADVNWPGEMRSHVHFPCRGIARVQGMRPLHWLAAADDEDSVAMAELLIARGADVGARNERGTTPLHQAACCGSLGMARLLISKHADVNARDFDDRTPVHEAAVHSRLKLISLLFHHGGDVKARDCHDWTPLHFAAWGDHPAAYELLVEYGADIRSADDAGQTPSGLAEFFGSALLLAVARERPAD